MRRAVRRVRSLASRAVAGAILVALFAAAVATLVGDLADRALGYPVPVWSLVLGALAAAAGVTVAASL